MLDLIIQNPASKIQHLCGRAAHAPVQLESDAALAGAEAEEGEAEA